jgi:hypothetical protein
MEAWDRFNEDGKINTTFELIVKGGEVGEIQLDGDGSDIRPRSIMVPSFTARVIGSVVQWYLSRVMQDCLPNTLTYKYDSGKLLKSMNPNNKYLICTDTSSYDSC